MAKALGALVIGAGCAGIYYLYTQTQQQPEQVAYVPVSQPARTKPKMDYAPLLSWGLGQVTKHLQNNKQPHWGTTVNRNKSKPSTTGYKPTPKPPQATGGASHPPSVGGLEGRLMQMIGHLEAPKGYDMMYGGSKIQPPKPLTQMTVREVLAYQDRSVEAGSKSSAAGRYQIIRGTLRAQVRKGAVSMNDRFSVATQDRLALSLMEGRGLSRYKTGKMSLSDFAQELSREWASLPAITEDLRGRRAEGQSYYAGDGLNKSLTSIRNVLDTITGGMG